MNRVHMSGGLSQLPLQAVQNSIELILQDVGEAGVLAMKGYTEPFDFTESLSRSLMWRTKLASGGNESGGPAIDAPHRSNSVYIGSANDHAYFREYGTGMHVTDDRQDEFLENIARWCEMKLHFSPEEDPGRYWSIVNNIRENGTEAAPFAFPASEEIRQFGASYARFHTHTFWRSIKR